MSLIVNSAISTELVIRKPQRRHIQKVPFDVLDDLSRLTDEMTELLAALPLVV